MQLNKPILILILTLETEICKSYKTESSLNTFDREGKLAKRISVNHRLKKDVVIKKLKKPVTKIKIKKRKRPEVKNLSHQNSPSPFPKVVRVNKKALREENGTSADPLRFLSPFTILTFPNLHCESSDATLDGTCYTSTECSQRGGKSLGACAMGFGVCCIFNLDCFSESGENGTIFTSPNTILPLCSAMIRFSSDICQIKLDFEDLVLLDPDAEGLCTEGDYLQIFGGAVAASSRLPLLCGKNSGQHMYLTVMQGLPIGLQIRIDTARTVLSRSWKIVVYHYMCNDANLPPEGCLQYFTGTTRNVQSFNFKTEANNNNPGASDGYSLHLSSNRYSICIRREEGYCSIAWTGNTFSLSQAGSAGDTSCTSDYVTIVDGFGVGEESCSRSRYCGQELKTLGGTDCGTETAGTVYSKVMPFVLGVVTDATETSSTPSETGDKGFDLLYQQLAC